MPNVKMQWADSEHKCATCRLSNGNAPENMFPLADMLLVVALDVWVFVGCSHVPMHLHVPILSKLIGCEHCVAQAAHCEQLMAQDKAQAGDRARIFWHSQLLESRTVVHTCIWLLMVKWPIQAQHHSWGFEADAQAEAIAAAQGTNLACGVPRRAGY